MIYRSNISAPDLQSHFVSTTICRPRQWSMGHEVLSDSMYEPECGFMTHDEAAILYECARRVGGEWLDIGGRTGWTTAHIAAGADSVYVVDSALRFDMMLSRFEHNMWEQWNKIAGIHHVDSNRYFAECWKNFEGVCIDGNHDAPYPLNDARNALDHLVETGVIVLHDFWGRPIREGVEYLIGQGLKCRTYDTPNGMAVCWRGDFTPPDHVPDPAVDWTSVRAGRASDFDFSRCA
mgnify:CR=1 FL=1